ncbi:MAG: hypothetical protein Q9212_006194, partial [Teloschistes hypoglaucus]
MVLSDSTTMEKLEVEVEHLPFLKQSWAFQLRTLWLFTKADVKNVIVPTTVFAFCCGFAQTTQQSSPVGGTVNDCLLGQLKRMPYVIAWTWTKLLVADISNQRFPTAVLEDKANKPWRPLPSQRITSDESRRLLLRLVPLIFLFAWHLDTFRESAVFTIFVWLYNDLGGSGESAAIRNALNAVGLTALLVGATGIVIRGSSSGAGGDSVPQLSSHTWAWLGIVASMVFTMVQVQDLADQAGDLLCRRKTMPLAYGETFTRWVSAVLILIWAFVCPRFWEVDLAG